MQNQTTDSRVHRRHPLRSRGLLLFNEGQAQIPIRTLDISVGGMTVVSEAQFPAKIQGIIQFNMPVGNGRFEPQKINVRVMHSIFCNKEDGFKVGLVFVNLPPSLLKTIQAMG